MNPAEHVTSLENSKKLFELGIAQISVWGLHWVMNEYSNVNGVESFNTMMLTHDVIGSRSKTTYKAFLASEIMAMLPDRFLLRDGEPYNGFRFDLTRSLIVEENTIHKTFIVNYVCDTACMDGKRMLLAPTLFPHNIWDKTLPDVLAKTLIYILENPPRVHTELEVKHD